MQCETAPGAHLCRESHMRGQTRGKTFGVLGLAVGAAWMLCGCGRGFDVPNAIPRPVAEATAAPTPQAPPRDPMDGRDSDGLCGLQSNSASTSWGHFNATDGGHYHAWLPAMGPVFYVEC